MKFRAFFRALVIVALLSVIALTVFANKLISDRSVQKVPESSITSTSTGTAAENTSANAADNAAQSSSAQEKSTGGLEQDVTIRVSALGDVALGQDNRYNFGDSFDDVFQRMKGDYGYFFSNVLGYLSQDDLTIANLETTLSNETQKAEKYDYGNNYWFNGAPKYANILKAGSVEVANLANNHTFDFGQKGYDATRKALEETGIAYFGYEDVLNQEVKGIKVGMIGFNQLGNVEQGMDTNKLKQDVADRIRKLRDESDLVIANFHWGKEYQYQPNALQKELAHLAIDSGADLVIGNHPHVLEPIEKYKGRYVVYSMGNFCFGGTKNPRDYDTAIYQQAFDFNTQKVLQPVKEPTVVPCSVSSKAIINDYRPTAAAEPQSSRVLKKLNFSQASTAGAQMTGDKTEMVRLDTYIKNIVINLRYATTDNVTGKKVYESNTAYLRKGTADKLNRAYQILLKKGYRIKVWDAYRKQKYHQFLYDNAPNQSVFMNPAKGPSNHTRGAAVDCTLITLDGKAVDMPSDFDNGTALAYRTYEKCTAAQKQNALILQDVMQSCGFKPYSMEWWHFDDTEYKSYDAIADYEG